MALNIRNLMILAFEELTGKFASMHATRHNLV